MKIFAEKEAESFLKKEGFEIVDSFFADKKKDLHNVVETLNFPIVVKVSGNKILHKNSLGGVRTGIENYEQVLEAFDSLMKIKNSEGVILQNQIQGKEFILGIKQTPEFGHVIAFGVGGVDVEKMKKVTFRICPIEEDEIKNIAEEIGGIRKEDFGAIKKSINKLCSLSKKYLNINELDINPLIVQKGKAIVVDARIIFD